MPIDKPRRLALFLVGALMAFSACSTEEAAGALAGGLQRTWQGDFAPAEARNSETLTLLDWNIERGPQLQAVQEVIQNEDPGLCILQEVDVNTRRTGNRNVAEDLASALGLNYVFGIEFLELSQGTASSPAYHGQATLTSLPILSHRVLRFAHQSNFWKPRWYFPNWTIFQRRLGGRMTLVTELGWSGSRLIVYNAHLESRTSSQGRLAQLEEVLADAGRYPAQTPIVLAGDLNTRSQPDLLVERLKRSGFRDVIGSRQATVPEQRTLGSNLLEWLLALLTGTEERGAGRSLDWVFVRGPLQARQGRVHHDIHASDHYPLTVRLSMARNEQTTR